MFNQAYGSGGSQNSSQSISNTAGREASATAQAQAAAANTSAMSAWQAAAAYNSEEAEKQRAWQERMANTVYQRTVQDMIKAGINPVLAAGMGLGTANVGGGSAANITPSQVFNAQTFPESNSASQANGTSWNHSESGLITFANALATLGSSLLERFNAGQTINIAIDGLKQFAKESYNDGKTMSETIAEKAGGTVETPTTSKKVFRAVEGVIKGFLGIPNIR